MIAAATISQIKQTAATILRQALPQIPLQNGWCKQQFFGTCTAPLATLTLRSLTAEDGGFYGASLSSPMHTAPSAPTTYLEQSGTLADCVLRLTLFLPMDSTLDADEQLERACSALAGTEEGDFYAFSLSAFRFVSSMQCFESTLDISCRMLLLRQKELVSLREIQVTADPIAAHEGTSSSTQQHIQIPTPTERSRL